MARRSMSTIRMDNPLASAAPPARNLEGGVDGDTARGGGRCPAHGGAAVGQLAGPDRSARSGAERIEYATGEDGAFSNGAGFTRLDGDEGAAGSKAEDSDRKNDDGDQDFGERECGSHRRAT